MKPLGMSLVFLILAGCSRTPNASPLPKSIAHGDRRIESAHAKEDSAPSCAQYPDRGKYWLRIQGDGDEQLFAEGTPISESGWRHCGPGGGLREGQLIAMGCAQASPIKRSCVFVMAPRVGYFDRDGVQHELTVGTLSSTLTATGADGVITTTETLPGRSAPLRIEFHLTRCPWTENGMGCGPQCVSDEG